MINRIAFITGLMAAMLILTETPAGAQEHPAGKHMVMEFKISFERVELSEVPAFISLAVKTEYRQVSISQAYKSRLPCGMVIYKLILNVDGAMKDAYYEEDGSKYFPGIND